MASRNDFLGVYCFWVFRVSTLQKSVTPEAVCKNNVGYSKREYLCVYNYLQDAEGNPVAVLMLQDNDDTRKMWNFP